MVWGSAREPGKNNKGRGSGNVGWMEGEKGEEQRGVLLVRLDHTSHPLAPAPPLPLPSTPRLSDPPKREEGIRRRTRSARLSISCPSMLLECIHLAIFPSNTSNPNPNTGKARAHQRDDFWVVGEDRKRAAEKRALRPQTPFMTVTTSARRKLLLTHSHKKTCQNKRERGRQDGRKGRTGRAKSGHRRQSTA